jgi:hypothetical protein
MKAIDKNGKEITTGIHVIMPEPNKNDVWIYGEFVAYVNDILDNGNLIVEDGDSDFFEVEANRVEIED